MTPRMRTIKEIFQIVKAADPETKLTQYAISRLVKENTIPSISIGKKRLVSVEAVEQYLKGEISAQQPQIISYNGIRRISGV